MALSQITYYHRQSHGLILSIPTQTILQPSSAPDERLQRSSHSLSVHKTYAKHLIIY